MPRLVTRHIAAAVISLVLGLSGAASAQQATDSGSVTLTGSVNVFGMPFSWAVSGAGVDISDFIALLTADSDSNASVVSPAVTPSDAGSLVYRLMFMNFPTAGAASGIITPADATEAFISPSMPSGTQRVSGGLAYEAGPGAGVSTGTEAWTVGGAEWGPAVGITIAIYPPSINTDAGNDQTVAPGTLVTLDPSGTVGADTREWDLISGTYPAAHLIPGVGDTLSFIAPTGPADLTFQLTATAGAVSGTDSVDVHVTAGGSGLRVGILGVSGQADYL